MAVPGDIAGCLKLDRPLPPELIERISKAGVDGLPMDRQDLPSMDVGTQEAALR